MYFNILIYQCVPFLPIYSLLLKRLKIIYIFIRKFIDPYLTDKADKEVSFVHRGTYLGRVAVIKIAYFIASEQASYITGSFIVVDGELP